MLPFAPAEALATSGRDHVTVSPYLDDEPESTYRAWLLPAGFDSWSVDEAADLVTRRLGGR